MNARVQSPRQHVPVPGLIQFSDTEQNPGYVA